MQFGKLVQEWFGLGVSGEDAADCRQRQGAKADGAFQRECCGGESTIILGGTVPCVTRRRTNSATNAIAAYTTKSRELSALTYKYMFI